jgi:eukaryotic-like serine/threonine-protein kinase
LEFRRMAEDKKCRNCGAAVPSNAPFGHCPKCLLELGFGELRQDAAEERASGTKVRYFGDYELLEQIGRGGMGVVYKARQRSLNRIVALKMIAAGELASPSAVQRFQIEAEAAAKLDHPNIVPIYEIGAHQGQHYFSMKFVEGESLDAHIRNKRFKLPAAGTNKSASRQIQSSIARLMVTLARAVHYAHQHGVLHRDLKPSNILLDGEGQPHLTDFGLAKILEHETGVTRTLEVMGTPNYMSPEQAAGQSLSMATDVYSSGAILYELLTGQPPFSGTSSMEILKQVTDRNPAHPQILNPLVHSDLATICLKCLEKNPQQRYSTAAGLAEDLENWNVGRPIAARPVTRGEKFWRWCRREPAKASMGAAVVLLLGVLWLGSMIAAVKMANQNRVIRKGEQAALRAQHEAMENLRESYLHQARANKSTGKAGRRFESLDVLAKAVRIRNGIDLRDEAISCLTLADIRPIKQLTKVSGPLAFDGDLERYATIEKQNAIVVRDCLRGDLWLSIPLPTGLRLDDLTFSADRRFLAAHGGQTALIWDLSTIPDHPGVVFTNEAARSALGFRPNFLTFTPGNEVAVGFASGILLVNAVNGREIRRINPRGASAVRFSPDGNRFCRILPGNQVGIFSSITGVELATLQHRTRIWDFAWHPDGKRVAMAGHDFEIHLWDVDTAKELTGWHGHDAEVVQVRFNKSGNILISGSWDCTTRLWDTDTRRELVRYPDSGWNLKINDRADRLVYRSWNSPDITLCELATGRELRQLRRHDGLKKGPYDIDFHPDGRLLAELGDSYLQLWDAYSGAWLAALPDSGNYPIQFSKDGQFLMNNRGGSRGVWPIRWQRRSDTIDVDIGPVQKTSIPFTKKSSVSWDGLRSIEARRDRIEVVDINTLAKRQLRAEGQVFSEIISPDGNWAAAQLTNGIQVWNLRTEPTPFLLAAAGKPTFFSPDSRWLLSTSDKGVGVWDIKSRYLHHLFRVNQDHEGRVQAFSADSKILALKFHPRIIKIVGVETGAELCSLACPQLVTHLALNYDGSVLAVAAESHELQLWDLTLVREGLKALNVDWESDHHSTVKKLAAPSNVPLRVNVHSSSPTTERRLPPPRRFPVRDLQADPALLDLTAYYNAGLSEDWHKMVGNNFSTLPKGVADFDGTQFDVRGAIQLSGYYLPKSPKEVSGISVLRPCQRIHFLHGTAWEPPVGTEIATYRIHFSNGDEQTIPIIYGEDLLNWHITKKSGRPSQLMRGKVAWTGTNAAGMQIRLFKTIWTNPSPAQEIECIDYASKMTSAAPFLIAITVE